MRTLNLRKIIATIMVSGGVLVFMGGCDGGREGDRCNPDLSHNDCNSGLTCVQPATCVESYCCPSNPTTSSNAYCNGNACPTVDAGDDDAAFIDEAGDAASD